MFAVATRMFIADRPVDDDEMTELREFVESGLAKANTHVAEDK
jgi:hypothetical protein